MTDCPTSSGMIAGSDDVALLYHMFLGRAPEEPSRLKDNEGVPVDRLARGFIGSAEFAARMARIESGQPLDPAASGVETDLSPALDLLSRITGSALPDPAPHSLRAILAAALASAALWPDFTRHFGSRAAPLLEAISADAPAVAESDWQGFIDFASDWLIRGWACRKDDPAPVRLGLLIDGKMIARVEASLFRPDVAEQLGLAGNCGFELRPLIPDALRYEGAVLSLVDLSSGAPLPYRREVLLSPPAAVPRTLDAELRSLVAMVGNLTDRLAGFGVPGPVLLADYQMFRSSYRLPAAPSEVRAGSAERVSFSLILPLLPGGAEGLEETLSSLLAQDWQDWELIAVTGRGHAFAIPDALGAAIARDTRIRLMETVGLRSMVEAQGVGIRAAQGSHVIPLAPGISLEPGALAWLAHVAGVTGARLIYTDHCRVSPLGAAEYLFSDPALKPAFDHDLLLQRDYIGPAVCLETALALTASATKAKLAGDLVFRAVERLQLAGIVHLPLPLFRLAPHTDTLPEESAYRRAALAHLSRLGLTACEASGKKSPHQQDEDWLCWPSPTEARRLSIIIASRDRRDLLEPCIDSIRQRLADPAQCEIVIVDNRSSDPATLAYLEDLSRDPGIRILPFDEEFNWSRANNLAAATCTSDLLLFLNNDIEILTPGFDELLRRQLSRPGAGVLGCLLLYPDGLIQHAGTVVGTSGVAAHIGAGQSPAAPDLPGWHRLTRQVSAVTGAFLAIPARLFDDIGGFDETALKITLNDVDLCLRVRESGRSVLYTPAITCLHYESASRGNDERNTEKSRRAAAERAVFGRRWQHRLRFDPFHGPALSLTRAPFSHAVMPTPEGIAAYLARQMQDYRT